MDESQYPALKAFLLADTLTYGFAPLIAQGEPAFGAIAALLNKVRDGTDGETAITMFRPDIAPIELFNVIDVRDFGGTPGVLGGAWFQSLMRETRIPLLTAAGQPNLIRQNLDRYIQNGNGSQTRLDALALRFVSYAEKQGWGRVESWDVGRALALP